jgi:hypothetical protein
VLATVAEHVFTQPGSKAALTAPKSNFRFTPESGLNSDIAPCPKSAAGSTGRRNTGQYCLRSHQVDERPENQPAKISHHSVASADSPLLANWIKFTIGTGPALHDPRPRSDLRHRRHTPIAHHGHSRQAHCASLSLAERLCRTADRIDPARVFGARHCFGRGTYAPHSEILRSLLQWHQNASVSKQRCAGFSACSAIRHRKFARYLGRTSSSTPSDLYSRYTLGSLKAIADLYAKAKLEPKLLFDSRASQPGLCSG